MELYAGEGKKVGGNTHFNCKPQPNCYPLIAARYVLQTSGPY